MDPNDYQQLAMRTECNQDQSLARIVHNHPPAPPYNKLMPVRLLHAALGLAGDAGELAGAVERWLYYGQDLDVLNVKEEVGDCLWYLAQACSAVGITLTDAMEANIAKLRTRYPERYSDHAAAEENRDRDAERAVMNSPEIMYTSSQSLESPSINNDATSEEIKSANEIEYLHRNMWKKVTDPEPRTAQGARREVWTVNFATRHASWPLPVFLRYQARAVWARQEAIDLQQEIDQLREAGVR